MKLSELKSDVSVVAWKNQIYKDYGREGITFKRLKVADGIDDKTIATKDGKIIATYNNNSKNGTVFEPKGQ